ncbi:MAG: glycogen debranching enzyme N-terminal domain-containing protein [Candidatus Hydrothermarchaeota archaeon]
MFSFTNPTYEECFDKEWIVTNGLGGYASSSITGANTRKYHGLLIVSLNPPADRWLLLSKLEESIIYGGKVYEISTNRYPDVIHPEGYKFLSQFVLDPFPRFIYRIEDVFIEKKVFMIHGENASVISYDVDPKDLSNELKICVRPLVNSRKHHENTHLPLDWEFLEDESKKKHNLKLLSKMLPLS